MEKTKVLIADDDRGLIMALTARLKKEGFEVIPATDAYQALTQVKAHQPDIIILDINMPCGDGFSVHDRLHKMAQSAIPVIYLTGNRSNRAEWLSKQLGAYALMYKPYDPETLVATIRAALDAA
jgi:DNA-binding response OmpR family regulator